MRYFISMISMHTASWCFPAVCQWDSLDDRCFVDIESLGTNHSKQIYIMNWEWCYLKIWVINTIPLRDIQTFALISL